MLKIISRSNNTNKLSPQELSCHLSYSDSGSNNTNKLSPQELDNDKVLGELGSNNTNKLSPQELIADELHGMKVQIIQINLVLKNCLIVESSTKLFK